MEPVATVSLFDISLPGPRDRVLKEWSGFMELEPATTTKRGLPMLLLGHPSAADWRWFPGLAPVRVPPIGCHFLRDIEILGVGLPFESNRYVREFSHTSDVGLEWLNSDDRPENPRREPPTHEATIDEPVLFVFGPGFPIFGHWLLDFLPRVAIAQRALGDLFHEFCIPLPEDTPEWVTEMLNAFCGVPARQIRTFSRLTDRLACSRVCIPSFAHDGQYAPHGFMRDFYGSFQNAGSSQPTRRLCLSRRNFERATRGVWRVFENRELFEEMAVAHGYEVVMPELLPFTEQVNLFRSAERIIGEHGSGMHSALFADPGTLVASFPLHQIQLQIGAAFGHCNVSVMRATKREEPGKPMHYTVAKEDLASLFVMLDTPNPTGISGRWRMRE